jgi:hypothetical protein
VPEINGLFPTKTRLALLRAIQGSYGRVYAVDGEARDMVLGMAVTARVQEFLAHDWIRALKPDEKRGPGERDDRTYYRLKPFGEAALRGAGRG